MDLPKIPKSIQHCGFEKAHTAIWGVVCVKKDFNTYGMQTV